jgi:hypothetical protein
MVQENNQGSILCCGTKGDASVEKAGLVLGHAYTIVHISFILVGCLRYSLQNGETQKPLGQKIVERKSF